MQKGGNAFYAQPMVITVTLNPAMDKTLYIDRFVTGQVNRVSKMRTDIGGKGINVARVLKNFGIDSICTGFLGRNLKDYFLKELELRKINTNFININGDTRLNTKIVDTVLNTHTDINEMGPEITEKELKQLIDNFSNMCSFGDIAVLSGGVSPSVPVDIYKKLINIAKEKGAITILDADGDLLKEGLKAKPEFIKPNEFEFKKLAGITETSVEAMEKGALKLISDGIQNVMISLGERGAIYVTEGGSYHIKAPEVTVRSTVGAGDSMVAALIYGIINKFSPEVILSYSVASGSAAVSLEGTEACTLEQVKEILLNKMMNIGVDCIRK